MSKSTTTYFGFLLVFGIGLWTILSFGALYSHAPTDISGEWKSEFGVTTRVEQSGDFVEMLLADGRQLSLVLESETRDKVGRPTMQFSGKKWKASIRQEPATDVYHFALSGPENIDFTARRSTPAAGKGAAAKTTGH